MQQVALKLQFESSAALSEGFTLQEMLTAIGGTGVLTGAIAWIAKVWHSDQQNNRADHKENRVDVIAFLQAERDRDAQTIADQNTTIIDLTKRLDEFRQHSTNFQLRVVRLEAELELATRQLSTLEKKYNSEISRVTLNLSEMEKRLEEKGKMLEIARKSKT